MSDLISRQAAINAFRSLFEDYISQFRIDTILKNLPSAGSKRKMGEWIEDSDPGQIIGEHYCCSVCHVSFGNRSNFCPNCGADMRGGNE